MRERLRRVDHDAWFTLLCGCAPPSPHYGHASERLSVLSDVQNSPVKSPPAAVNHNTDWGPCPSRLSPLGHVAEDSRSSIKGVFASQGAAEKPSSPSCHGLTTPAPPSAFRAGLRGCSPRKRRGRRQYRDGPPLLLPCVKFAVPEQYPAPQDRGQEQRCRSEPSKASAFEVTLVRITSRPVGHQRRCSLRAVVAVVRPSRCSTPGKPQATPAVAADRQSLAQDIARPGQQVMAHRYLIVASSDTTKPRSRTCSACRPWTAGYCWPSQAQPPANPAAGEGLAWAAATTPAPGQRAMVDSIDKASSGQVIASLPDRENG